MSKRVATSELNHDNWNDSYEAEEAGSFKTAPESEISKRKMKIAKRRSNVSSNSASSSPFAAFVGFKAQTPNNKPIFNLSHTNSTPVTNGSDTEPSVSSNALLKTNIPNSTESKDSESTSPEDEYAANLSSLNKTVSEWIKTHVEKNSLCILTPIFSDYERYLKEIRDKRDLAKNSVVKNDGKSPLLMFKSKDSDSSEQVGKSASFMFKSKGSDDSEQVGKSPLLMFKSKDSDNSEQVGKSSTFVFRPKSKDSDNSEQVGKSPLFMFNSKDSQNAEENGKSPLSMFKPKDTEDNKKSSFSLFKPNTTESSKTSSSNVPTPSSIFGNVKADSATQSLLLKKPDPSSLMVNPFTTKMTSDASQSTIKPFTFGDSSKPFTFSNVTAPPSSNTTEQEEESEEPPKVEFKPVQEEGALFSKRCKVFIKKDSSYTDRGIGTLHVKKVSEEKHQLIVRADTVLGNILINVLLSSSIPLKRMGKNNVMLVCVPTPDSTPPPTTVLLRVKTSEEADELLNNLERYKN